MHFWSKGVFLKPYWLILLVLLTYAATTCFAQNLNATEQLSRQYPDSVYRVIKARLDQAVRQQDKLAEGIHLQDIGLLFYHQGNYAQAIDFLLQAQKIFLVKKDANRLARNRNELGTVYYYNEQVEQALAQFNEALTFYQQQHNASGLAQTYANIGHIYEKRQSPNLAYRYQKLALANSRMAHDTVSLIKIYENLGSIFEDEARYDSAHYYYQNALTLAQQTRDEISQLEILNNLGDVFRKTGKYAQGLAYSRKALRMSQEKGELYQISAALRDIAKTYRLMNQPDSAYTYIERSRDLTDEIYGIENNRQITLLQTLYEVERKDSEIEQLNAQKRTDLIIIIATVVVLLLIGILGAVIIRQQRLKLQNQRERIEVELKNRQLEEENLKSQLELKSKELTAHTLQIIQKNQVLEELKNDLTAILKDDKRDQKKLLRQLAQKIDLSFNQDKYWDDFRTIFDQVHPNFFHSLTQQFPDLTATDLRLIALLKMNINSTDVATLLGISPDSLRVARYRLRKKISLAEGESLSTFIQRFPSPIQPYSEKI
ncbi:tetratricopeptide repeat protein [Spirosoma panaciterrae]|uniref:tetratricopeptide repeat protein n=1 Tax=Spirosoma panaciterrae TaxID=496058 RepID=UPI000380D69B|nr:tetratricopeptide repeat protein [Spirosoma panaciterrae]